MASPILSDAAPVLHDQEHFGNKIGGAILEGNKFGTTATEAGHLFVKEDFPHFRNESGIDTPFHDNSLTEIDVADDSPLSTTKNGRVVQLAIALATALKSGVMSPEQFSLLQAVLDASGVLLYSDANGNAVLGGELTAGSIETASLSGLSSTYSGDSDAASQGFVNNLIQDLNIAVGGRDFKDSVLFAYTTNLPLNSRPPAQGGVTVANGESVLLLGQANAAENGAYIWDGTNLVRRADSNAANLSAGATYYVEAGDFASYHYTLATADFTLDTDPLIFLDASDVALAGDGLVKEGRTIHARGVADEIVITADAIGIAPAYTAAIQSRIDNAVAPLQDADEVTALIQSAIAPFQDEAETNALIATALAELNEVIAPLQDATEVNALIESALATHETVGEYVEVVGDGSALEFTINHGLNNPLPSATGFYNGAATSLNYSPTGANSILIRASLGNTPIEANSLTVVVRGKRG